MGAVFPFPRAAEDHQPRHPAPDLFRADPADLSARLPLLASGLCPLAS